MHRRTGALLLGTLMSALPMTGLAAGRIDCSLLKEQRTPEQADQWFAYSIMAGRCHDFRAVAMRIGPGGIRTVEIRHRVSDEGEWETTRFLDGPHPDVRSNAHLERRWQIAAEALNRAGGDEDDVVTAMKRHYRFRMVGQSRVADREAVVIDIQPRDALRYGHRLWLDRTTGLLLKQQLLGRQGDPLEVIQLASLSDVSLYAGQLALPDRRRLPESRWSPQWLPPGFYPQPVDDEVVIDGVTMRRQLYSDGLSTLSVFLGPLDEAVSLREGVHQLGNFRAASRHLSHDRQSWQLVAVGEVPTEVLTHTVSGIDWQSGNDAEAETAAAPAAGGASPSS
ncbi:MucB/RseB-like sigma(E) regulatory protein [Kushneria sinocarnis]|uniref:MucB/RseB-like sigma(E) regulatory protein n=1 Tax=Kushneria sinocarnis TaxID=595502 RepID=A0A420WYS0_9GAMM|nr:MucB/RseB C-terminal domain-containing protein [Kushneria sinocarnis]RKR06323.1 MucB/RseB-like sigma(E) regulatory protein [Kushneria sinocarnis]